VFELFGPQASRGHDFIGTEHLLLGLVTVTDGLAGQVLTGQTILYGLNSGTGVLSGPAAGSPPGWPGTR
jgi:Clp amino terminal domain, pathogenicity island component